MSTPMFRKAAMDKVSSPEQLDLLMQVTSPMGWLALATVGVILVIGGIWSVVGEIPDLAAGEGVLLRGERLIEVKSRVSGVLTELPIAPGQEVTEGQTIAIVNQDKAAIEEKIALKEQELARVRMQHEGENAADRAAISRNNSLLTSKRGELQLLKERRARLKGLVDKGLKAENVLIEADLRVNGISAEMNGIQKENAMLRNRIAPRENQQMAVQAEIQQLRGQASRTTTEMPSPMAGRVVEVIKSRNDVVREGEPLIRLEPLEGGQDAGGGQTFCEGRTHLVVYVPGNVAGKVRKGHMARVNPTDVKKEEFGYMPGKVEWIATHPASPPDMKETLKNDMLVNTYTQGGAVYEVRVCLEPDESKASGFQWSSSDGPDRVIDTGAMCTADVVVAKKRPISYVLPVVRESLGM